MDIHSLMPKKSERPRLKPCCKNKKLPWMEGTLDTNYRREYVEKEVPVQRAARTYDDYPKLNAPRFDGTTTMGNDYRPFEVKREAAIRPPNTTMESGLPFNADSTYKNDFGPKEAPYARVRPDNAFEPNKAPFDGTTTHRNDFQQREIPAPRTMVTRQANIPTSSGPFDGQSLYKDTFQKQPYARRGLAKPVQGGDVLPRGNFDDGTMYRAAYVPKEIQVPTQFRPQDARPHTTGPWFNGLPSSEYRNQFIGKEAPTAKATRPLSATLQTGPFDGTTTNRADFIPFAVPSQGPSFKPTPALGPDRVPFQGTTTYQGAFFPKEAPYNRVRPVNAFEPNKAPFDGTTTHRTAFIPREVQPTARVQAHGTSLAPQQLPFEGRSQYKDDFTKMVAAARRPITQPHNKLQSGPFDGNTTYRVDYIEKEIPDQPYIRNYDDECESCVDGIPGVTCREV